MALDESHFGSHFASQSKMTLDVPDKSTYKKIRNGDDQMTIHVAGAKTETVISAMHRAVAKCTDPTAATEALVQAARTNKDMATELLRAGASAFASRLIRQNNSVIYSGRPVRQPIVDDGIAARALEAAQRRAQGAQSRHVRLLLDAILPNRTVMRDATSADIADAISVYEPQARDMTEKVTYFRAVLAGLKDGKTVGQCFDNQTLTKLLETARE